jgi:hypothetical protein
VRLDGDEMAANADDGDAGHFSRTYIPGSQDLGKALRYLQHDAAVVSLGGRPYAAASGDLSPGVGAMKRRTANRISGVLGMLAGLWALFGILASNVGAPWKILFGPFALGLFLSSLLQFLGLGRSNKGQDKQLK